MGRFLQRKSWSAGSILTASRPRSERKPRTHPHSEQQSVQRSVHVETGVNVSNLDSTDMYKRPHEFKPKVHSAQYPAFGQQTAALHCSDPESSLAQGLQPA